MFISVCLYISFVLNDRLRATCPVVMLESGGLYYDVDLVSGTCDGFTGIVVYRTVFDASMSTIMKRMFSAVDVLSNQMDIF